MTTSIQSNQFKDMQRVNMVLNSCALQSADEAAPKSFYVAGHIEGGHFVASSSVIGTGELASTGRPGWLELGSGKFYSMETPRAPSSPYVNGYMTNEGFAPSTLTVH